MAGRSYITNRDRLFDEDDVDDDTFLKNSRVQNSNPFGGGGSMTNDMDMLEQQRQQLQERREQIERDTLMSTNRSLGLLHETEQVGIATAEELSRQREQLEKTSERLDNINATLRFSQKHLNGLKSVFGGLKNYLSSGGKEYSPKMTSSPSGSKFSETSSSQPTTIAAPSQQSDPFENHPVNRLRSDPSDNYQVSDGNHFQARLDRNLGDMADSLTRLRGLALDLNTEIEGQNDLLDNITNKVEDVDIKIGKQNKDMNKLLGKK